MLPVISPSWALSAADSNVLTKALGQLVHLWSTYLRVIAVQKANNSPTAVQCSRRCGPYTCFSLLPRFPSLLPKTTSIPSNTSTYLWITSGMQMKFVMTTNKTNKIQFHHQRNFQAAIFVQRHVLERRGADFFLHRERRRHRNVRAEHGFHVGSKPRIWRFVGVCRAQILREIATLWERFLFRC